MNFLKRRINEGPANWKMSQFKRLPYLSLKQVSNQNLKDIMNVFETKRRIKTLKLPVQYTKRTIRSYTAQPTGCLTTPRIICFERKEQLRTGQGGSKFCSFSSFRSPGYFLITCFFEFQNGHVIATPYIEV